MSDREEEHAGGLVRDIFGGSDSELSSDDEVPVRLSPARAESVGEESGDDYVQEKEAAVPKKKKKRVSRPRDGDDGMEVDRTSRKRKRKAPAPKVNLDELPPEEARRMKLDMQIEAILKTKKAVRPKKRKNADEDINLDRIADDEVLRLKDDMNSAVEADILANKDKLPGTAKLRLLPQVMEVLQKSSLAQAIVDNNLLECVRRWLEPLPDKSLPALNIQTAFFEILGKMEIDTSTLKESRLGRIVLFYTRCKRVTTKIRRQADNLVAIWSRPIIKRSASYRDRHIPTIDLDQDAGRGAGEKLNAILARGRVADKSRTRKNAVAIPVREMGTYTVAPRTSNAPRPQDSVDLDIERRRKNAERLRNLTKRVAQHQKAGGMRG